MEKLIALLSDAGVSTALAAVATVILTGIIKLPVKKLAAKSGHPEKITRFVVFLPLICGFCLTLLFDFAFCGKIAFDRQFFMRWLSAVSLSLAIYAFWEKFIPSGKEILSAEEIERNKQAIEQIKQSLPAAEELDISATGADKTITPDAEAENSITSDTAE